MTFGTRKGRCFRAAPACSGSSNKSARGENQLQVAALELVMEVLVAQLEPGGVVGPSAVAGWIGRAALVRLTSVGMQHCILQCTVWL
jgi:hypothetical protein